MLNSIGRLVRSGLSAIRPPSPNYGDVIIERRRVLAQEYIERHGRTVQAGPFRGMLLSEVTSWGFSDELPKALGHYESELHDYFETLKAQVAVDAILDIGCADGFYAVGLALLFDQATVYAYDTDPAAQDATRQAARQNHVAERVEVRGHCDPAALQHALDACRHPFVLCDCEGYEMELIDPSKVPALAKTHMIVEMHDFAMPGASARMIDRLGETHDVRNVPEGPRDPNRHPWQSTLWSADRWLTVCEFRPGTMNWLLCSPKQDA